MAILTDAVQRELEKGFDSLGVVIIPGKPLMDLPSQAHLDACASLVKSYLSGQGIEFTGIGATVYRGRRAESISARLNPGQVRLLGSLECVHAIEAAYED